MAYSKTLAERIRMRFAGRIDVVERRMFGGLAFMLCGHMCCGVLGTRLVARVGRDQYSALLGHRHVQPFDFTGRPLTGFLYVKAAGLKTDRDLAAWIRRCQRCVAALAARTPRPLPRRPRPKGRAGRRPH